MGHVRGIVFGCFGEASQATHDLIQHLAVSRVCIANPQRNRTRNGQIRSEQAEISLTTAFIRRSLSIRAVKAQAFSLLGRIEVLGSGTNAANGRRNFAIQLERQYSNIRKAHSLSVRLGRSILRRGLFETD